MMRRTAPATEEKKEVEATVTSAKAGVHSSTT